MSRSGPWSIGFGLCAKHASVRLCRHCWRSLQSGCTFGVAAPLWEHWSDLASEGVRFIFLSPRNIYNLFVQSALIAKLAAGITVVLMLGDIDLSATATAGVCTALHCSACCCWQVGRAVAGFRPIQPAVDDSTAVDR